MTDKEKILKYLDNKGISKNKFYQKTGLSVGFLDSGSSLGVDKLRLIVDNYHDLNPEWFFNDDSPMLKNGITAYKEGDKEFPNIPLVNQLVAAGFGSSNFAIGKSDVKDYYVIPRFKDRKIDFMIEVSGSSMLPKYNSGDVIACTIIKESGFIQWNKVHVIATREQGLLVKRIKESGNDSILAISDNKEYPSFSIPKEDITGIALVVGVIRLE